MFYSAIHVMVYCWASMLIDRGATSTASGATDMDIIDTCVGDRTHSTRNI